MSKNTLLSNLINYISANSSGNVVVAAPTSGFALDVTGTGRFTGALTLGSTITNGTFTYTLPSATGTLALTSALGSYLPLSGGTLTGALSGTSATFTTALTAGNGTAAISLAINRGAAGDGGGLRYQTAGTNNWYVGTAATGTSTDLEFYNHNTATSNLKLSYSTGDATFSNAVTARAYGIREASSPRGGFYPYNIISGAGTDYSIGLFSESSLWFAAGGGITKNLVVTSAGNVCINTTAPSEKLHVAGNAYISGVGSILYFDTDASSKTISQFVTNLYEFHILNGRGNSSRFVLGNGSISLGTSATPQFFINTGNGNVGIGTTAPNARLDVGYVAGGVALRVERDANNRLDFYQGGGVSYIDSSPAGAQLAFSTVGSERMRITSGGNVGIGTTNPLRRFVVEAAPTTFQEVGSFTNLANNSSGDFAIVTRLGTNASNTNSYHYIAVTGAADKMYIYGNGNVVNTNNSYGTLSDIRLKENVTDATPKLADLLSVKIKNFNLIGDDTKQIGVIAQELEEIFPSMVETDGKTGMKQVKTSIFVPMLIKAVQELNEKIKTLENK